MSANSPNIAIGRLNEDCVESSQVYSGHLLDVRRDQVRLPDGTLAHREYIVHPGAVMVVPVLDDDRLVVVRQFRYPLHQVVLEFPAGKLDAGEAPWDCAIRELAEETGYVARQWARAGILHNAIAYSTEGIEVWFAKDMSGGQANPDAGEFLEVDTASLEELELQAMQGRLTDAKTLIGLLWLSHWRAGRWPLQWRDAPPPVTRG